MPAPDAALASGGQKETSTPPRASIASPTAATGSISRRCRRRFSAANAVKTSTQPATALPASSATGRCGRDRIPAASGMPRVRRVPGYVSELDSLPEVRPQFGAGDGRPPRVPATGHPLLSLRPGPQPRCRGLPLPAVREDGDAVTTIKSPWCAKCDTNRWVSCRTDIQRVSLGEETFHVPGLSWWYCGRCGGGVTERPLPARPPTILCSQCGEPMTPGDPRRRRRAKAQPARGYRCRPCGREVRP